MADNRRIFSGGRYSGESGEWIGDGSDSFLKRDATEERTEPVREENNRAADRTDPDAPRSSRIMYLNRGSFIRWMIAFVVVSVICVCFLKLPGLALSYVIVCGIYGSRITGIGLLDAAADSMESSIFASIGGVLKMAIAFFAGYVLFPVHTVRAIIALVRGEI